MTIAHVAGVPVEEVLVAYGGAGVWLAARAWAAAIRSEGAKR
jgi:hypothetical protein